MNWSMLMYIAITLAYGEIMYERGHRDIKAMVEKINDRCKMLMEEKNDTDQEN